jgi:hypothetical protein
LFDAAASEISLIVGGLRTIGPFPFCRFHDLMRAAHHREPGFLEQGGADSCANHAADDDGSCRDGTFAENEIDSLGFLQSN